MLQLLALYECTHPSTHIPAHTHAKINVGVYDGVQKHGTLSGCADLDLSTPLSHLGTGLAQRHGTCPAKVTVLCCPFKAKVDVIYLTN